MKAEVEAEDQEENAAATMERTRPSTAPVASGLELELEPMLSSTLSTTNAQWHLIHSERHVQEQREAEANGVSALKSLFLRIILFLHKLYIKLC